MPLRTWLASAAAALLLLGLLPPLASSPTAAQDATATPRRTRIQATAAALATPAGRTPANRLSASFSEAEINQRVDDLIWMTMLFSAEQVSADLQPGGVEVTVRDVNTPGDSVRCFFSVTLLSDGTLSASTSWAIYIAPDGSQFPFTDLSEFEAAAVLTVNIVRAQISEHFDLSSSARWRISAMTITDDAVTFSIVLTRPSAAPTSTPSR